MTNEEYNQFIPFCLRYKEPGKPNGCRKHPNNNDYWDELEDPCEHCTWWSYVNRKELLAMTLEEALETINSWQNGN